MSVTLGLGPILTVLFSPVNPDGYVANVQNNRALNVQAQSGTRYTRSQPTGLHENGWIAIEHVDLNAEYRIHVPVLDNVPYKIRRDCERIYAATWRNLAGEYESSERDELKIIRGWHLFCLVSRLLLHRLRRGSSEGTRELRQRVQAFDEGRWDVLLESARACGGRKPVSNSEPSDEELARKIEFLAQRGELSHAARLFRSSEPYNQDGGWYYTQEHAICGAYLAGSRCNGPMGDTRNIVHHSGFSLRKSGSISQIII